LGDVDARRGLSTGSSSVFSFVGKGGNGWEAGAADGPGFGLFVPAIAAAGEFEPSPAAGVEEEGDWAWISATGGLLPGWMTRVMTRMGTESPAASEARG